MEEYHFDLQIDCLGFDSDLWEVFRGAYGTIKEDLLALLEADPNIAEEEKRIYMDKMPESAYRIAFDNICEQLIHQCSFYSALYLAIPYLVHQYAYWYNKNDLQCQILYLTYIGIMLSTDNFYNIDQEKKLKDVPQNILNHYQKSVEWIKERAKEFLNENLKKWNQSNHFKLSAIEAEELGTGLLGILGDRETAFLLLLYAWGSYSAFCKNCGYFDEDIELNNLDEEEAEQLYSKIIPADSAIGKWNFRDYRDSYIWLSNVLFLFGNKEAAEKLSYYYGTYTCPNCGKKDKPIVKLMMLGLLNG